MLLVPQSEAFALPISVERTTMQRPHAEYGYATRGNAHASPHGWIYISAKGMYRCCILDWDKKVAKFLTAKKERRVNAFQSCCRFPAPRNPTTGPPRAVSNRKDNKLFQNTTTIHPQCTVRRLNRQVRNYEKCLKNSIFGVEKLSFLRGLLLSFFCISISWWGLISSKSDPLGIYWRMSLLVYSTSPFAMMRMGRRNIQRRPSELLW